MQHAVREQNLHDLRNAAGGVQFRDDVFARGLQIAEHRNALGEWFRNRPERSGTLRGARDGQQVQDGVGRAADGH